jgi:hypothetical protein
LLYNGHNKGGHMLFLISVIGCGFKSGEDTGQENLIKIDILSEFEAQLTGDFDSSKQSQEEPQYYDVSLKACSIDVKDASGTTLYIEQALSNQLLNPYRQRIYILNQVDDHHVRSEIYELIDPTLLTGFCRGNTELDLSMTDLRKKEGCAVDLEWNGSGFIGQTDVGTCLSDMNGATYATSIVETSTEIISSWDQGWDSTDAQVWGAVDGPYIFIRK